MKKPDVRSVEDDGVKMLSGRGGRWSPGATFLPAAPPPRAPRVRLLSARVTAPAVHPPRLPPVTRHALRSIRWRLLQTECAVILTRPSERSDRLWLACTLLVQLEPWFIWRHINETKQQFFSESYTKTRQVTDRSLHIYSH